MVNFKELMIKTNKVITPKIKEAVPLSLRQLKYPAHMKHAMPRTIRHYYKKNKKDG